MDPGIPSQKEDQGQRRKADQPKNFEE